MNKDERIAELEREVAQKDELIKQLGEANKFLQTQIKELLECSKQMLNEGKEIMLNIRNQVCEEIRERFGLNQAQQTFNDGGLEPNEIKVSYDTFVEILNQIEEGE